MAEERNLATARAADTTDDADSTKAELQRRMEEARESISQTVSEIKDTVTTQYQTVRDSFTEALDWREQVRRRPVAWSAGALTAGILAGYGIGSAFMGRSAADYQAYDEDDDSENGKSSYGARYAAYEGGRASSYGRDDSGALTRSYAAQGITGSSSSSAYGRNSSSDYRPSYSSGYTATDASDKPGLIEKFKGTQAFERLQSEVSALGDRFIDEISSVGQNVVLPALLGKVKELFGVDLSNKTVAASQQRASTSSYGGSASSGASQGRSAYAGGSTTGNMDSYRREDERQASSGGSYGTSENRDYNVASRDRDEYERGGTSRDRDDYGRGSSNYGRDR